MDTKTDTPVAATIDDPRSEANIARRRALGIAERAPNGQLYPGSVLLGAGRKPDALNITALARTHTDKAIALLAKAVEDDKQPMAARVTAAQALLDRGWGKAPIQIDMQVKARFDDFLRDVGLAARYEHDHPELLPAVLALSIDGEVADD